MKPRKKPHQASPRYRRPICPPELRHRIAPSAAGGFDLVTHYGHVLYHHEDQAVVAGYYAHHCPIEDAPVA